MSPCHAAPQSPSLQAFEPHLTADQMWKVDSSSKDFIVCHPESLVKDKSRQVEPKHLSKVKAVTPLGERDALWSKDAQFNIFPSGELKKAVKSIRKTEDGSYNIIQHNGVPLPLSTQNSQKPGTPKSGPRVFMSSHVKIAPKPSDECDSKPPGIRSPR